MDPSNEKKVHALHLKTDYAKCGLIMYYFYIKFVLYEFQAPNIFCFKAHMLLLLL